MKQDISRIDPNFLSGSVISGEYVWMDVQEKPFEIRGLAKAEGDIYCRLPEEILPGTNEGVQVLAYHTAGGRVRFRSDAPEIAVRVYSRYANMMSHMPLTGSAGVDVYLNGKFGASIRPQKDQDGWYEGVFRNPFGLTDIEINLPLYNGLKHMLIGVPENSCVEAPLPYAIDIPVVYYGSSITQGGCCSRPGNTYQGHISRWLGSDHINLGFSGSARGEEAMAKYIASLSMSAFVYDYDHNAPTAEHLEKTHKPFFELIRKAHPDIPVIFITRPDTDALVYYDKPGYKEKCRSIIYKTYQDARSGGDTNVIFIDGKDVFGKADRDACTIDGCHPNDYGFYRMAETIYPVLKEMLEK